MLVTRCWGCSCEGVLGSAPEWRCRDTSCVCHEEPLRGGDGWVKMRPEVFQRMVDQEHQEREEAMSEAMKPVKVRPADEALDRARRDWTKATGYVAQGGSWCICDDGTCRVCEAGLSGRKSTQEER